MSFFNRGGVAFALVLALVSFLDLQSQVVIGDENSNQTTSNFPFRGYYDYSWSSTIYLSTELNGAGTINGISLLVSSGDASYTMNNQAIYIKHTNVGAFSNTDEDYPYTSSFTKVYDGSITYPASGWIYIPFTSGFEYDGIDNLQILFVNNDGSYTFSGFPYFTISDVADNRTKRDYKDYNFPFDCYLCNAVNKIPVISFDKVSCEEEIISLVSSADSIVLGDTVSFNIENAEQYLDIVWQKSHDGSTFEDIPGAIGYELSLIPNKDASVRAMVEHSSGCFELSNELRVIVDKSGLNIVSIEVGNDELTRTPVYGYYDYSWSSIIYKSNEINTSGQLSSIAFYASTSPDLLMQNQQIYVRHTGESSHSNGDYPGLTGFTKVFDGSIQYGEIGWIEVILDNTFDYDGVSNLEILVLNNDGSYSLEYPRFRGSRSYDVNRMKRDYRDGFFPSTCYLCNEFSYLPDVQLTFLPCDFENGILSNVVPYLNEGELVSLSWTNQGDRGVIEWQSSVNGQSYQTISNLEEVLENIEVFDYPVDFRVKETYEGCSNFSNVTRVMADTCFFELVRIEGVDENTNNFPINAYYDYSWSNFIYKSEEMGASGTISSISFDIASISSTITLNNQKIYFKHVNKDNFLLKNYPGTNGYELVFDGSITFSETGWIEIPLDNEFIYNGEDNLEILIENKDGSYEFSYPRFNYQTGLSNYRLRRDYKDGSFPSDCRLCQRYQHLPSVRFVKSTIVPVLAESQEALPGQQIQLSGPLQGFEFYNWTTNDTLGLDTLEEGFFASPISSSYYVLEGQTMAGCSFRDSVHVGMGDSIYVTDPVMSNSPGSLDNVVITAVASANLGNDVTILLNVPKYLNDLALIKIDDQIPSLQHTSGSITIKSAYNAEGLQGLVFGDYYDKQEKIEEFFANAELKEEQALFINRNVTSADKYNKLKRTADNSIVNIPEDEYYVPISFKNRFAKSSFVFNVYNKKLEKVSTGAFTLEAGENKFVYNLKSGLPAGYYTYELINEKGDKFYLQFYISKKVPGRRVPEELIDEIKDLLEELKEAILEYENGVLQVRNESYE